MAVAVALLAADRWEQIEARLTQPKYRTVTTSAPRPRGEVIRAVFSPTITLVELQTILDEAQLRIVSGPTEAGVYSLASNFHPASERVFGAAASALDRSLRRRNLAGA